MGSTQSQEFCQVECEDGSSESLGDLLNGDLLNVSALTHSDLDPYLTRIGVGTGVSRRLKYRGIKTVALLKDEFHRAGDYHEERVRKFDSWLNSIKIGSCDSNRITQDLAADHPEGNQAARERPLHPNSTPSELGRSHPVASVAACL